jgi:hypothetical protein
MSQHLFNQDYRNSMQQAAFAYLQRHDAQYLGDSDLLFDNCVRHLTFSLDVPAFLAQKLTHNAWTELRALRRSETAARAVLVLTTPLSPYALLIDARTHHRYCISARLLPQQLLTQQPAAQQRTSS